MLTTRVTAGFMGFDEGIIRNYIVSKRRTKKRNIYCAVKYVIKKANLLNLRN